MAGSDEVRGNTRFVSQKRIDGTFSVGSSNFAVRVRDLSVSGAQIEHTNTLRPSMRGVLTMGRLDAPAVVVWTRMSAPGLYRSGLRLEETKDIVAAEIRDMIADGVIHTTD